MKKEYIKPTTIESSVLADEIMLSPFSKIDNTGNGGSDGEIFKPIDGNPEDDEVGAKPFALTAKFKTNQLGRTE